MAWNLMAMIKNAFGELVPQLWNEAADTYQVWPGDSTEGGKVQVTRRKTAAKRYRNVNGASVALGGVVQYTITPSAGHLGRVLAVGFQVAGPAGAASGAHSLFVHIGTDYGAESDRIGYHSTAFDEALVFTPYSQEFNSSLKGCVFSPDNPLMITYSNQTDTANVQDRYVLVLWEEEAVF